MNTTFFFILNNWLLCNNEVAKSLGGIKIQLQQNDVHDIF